MFMLNIYINMHKIRQIKFIADQTALSVTDADDNYHDAREIVDRESEMCQRVHDHSGGVAQPRTSLFAIYF